MARRIPAISAKTAFPAILALVFILAASFCIQMYNENAPFPGISKTPSGTDDLKNGLGNGETSSSGQNSGESGEEGDEDDEEEEEGDDSRGTGGAPGGGGGASGDGGGGGGAPSAIINFTNIEDPDPKIRVISSYKCGSDICFQVKAADDNLVDISMSGLETYINSEPVSPIDWEGGVSGSSCISTEFLEPGQSCFGKILSAECLSTDIFRVIIPLGFEAWSYISECG
ncbi:MAG: hypothetical protein JW727_02935 [Candidatus Aenigmarchaeota archaeon]|nr:hypothetical protein [Candidatus Aenigmarchaeota archaeon]